MLRALLVLSESGALVVFPRSCSTCAFPSGCRYARPCLRAPRRAPSLHRIDAAKAPALTSAERVTVFPTVRAYFAGRADGDYAGPAADAGYLNFAGGLDRRAAAAAVGHSREGPGPEGQQPT